MKTRIGVKRTRARARAQILTGIGLALVLIPSSCLSPTTEHFTSTGDAVTAPGPATTSGTGNGCQAPPSGSFAFCAASAQALHLGVSKVFNLTLNAAPDFEGDVNLTIDRAMLDTIDTKARVGTQLNMATVHLTPGSSTSVPIMVTTNTQAPDFSSHFTVMATQMGGAASSSTTDVPLQVEPIYDVFLHGGKAPETWDAANPAGTTTNFSSHTAGVTINYYNMDTASTHIIHGNGAVPHQNTATPLKVSPGGGVAGGLYTVQLTGTTVQNGSFYCHTHESSSVARAVMTNQP